MKNLNDFEKTYYEFAYVITKNLESDGFELILDLLEFMAKHNFESKVIRNFYDDEDVKVMFITDNPSNNYGYVFVQVCKDAKLNRYQMFTFIGDYNDLGRVVLHVKKILHPHKITNYPCL